MDLLFSLTLDEVNAILNALYKAPISYAEASPLISKMQQQAQAQLQPPEQEKQEDEQE